MTNSISEIANADVIFVIGSNTTENHPVLALEIKKAVEQNGAKLIVADPRRIELVDYAAVWLSQQPGTDVALVNGMINAIIASGLADKAFVAERTEGFEALAESVSGYTPEAVEKVTGVKAADIIAAARLFAESPAASILYAMGITQHTSGTNNVLALANLSMVTGQIGKPASGVNPLRGQNNVQGACDMGGLPNVFTGYQRVDDETARTKFEGAWGRPLSARPGLTLLEMMEAIGEGRIKALFILGENPLLTDPDATRVADELSHLDLLVVQDIFLTETAELAHIVLPGVSFAEKDGTFTNTERRVQRVRAAIKPLGEARPDWQILCDLASRLGYPMNYDSPGAIMDEIASLTPSYGGIRYSRLEGRGPPVALPGRGPSGNAIPAQGAFRKGQGEVPRHAVCAASRAARRGVPFPFDDGPHALPLPWRSFEKVGEPFRDGPGAGDRHQPGRCAKAGLQRRRRDGFRGVEAGTHRSEGAGGRLSPGGARLHDLPLQGGGSERADPRRPRSRGEDPRVQGLRGADPEACLRAAAGLILRRDGSCGTGTEKEITGSK